MSQPFKYSETKALSQSSLKSLDWNPKKFYEEEYLWLTGVIPSKPDRPLTDSMKIGDLVDIHFTRPKDLDNEYVIIPEAPTGQMLAFVDEYFRLERAITLDFTESFEYDDDFAIHLAQSAYDVVGFKRDKLATVIERFKTEGAVYYTALRKSIGKTPASLDVRRSADYIIRAFEQDRFIGPIMRLQESPMLKIYNQLEIYFKIGEVLFKALLDKVVVDDTEMTIQPYDIKTASDVFPNSFMNWRYDLQGAFYTMALAHWMSYSGMWNGDLSRQYTILPFKFIVGYTTGQRPEIWVMTKEDMIAGKIGGTNRYGRQVKGCDRLIDDYKWHVEKGQWDYPRDVYENDGVRLLNCYTND